MYSRVRGKLATLRGRAELRWLGSLLHYGWGVFATMFTANLLVDVRFDHRPIDDHAFAHGLHFAWWMTACWVGVRLIADVLRWWAKPPPDEPDAA